MISSLSEFLEIDFKLSRGVTSISKEVGRKVELDEVKPKLKAHLQQLLGFEYTSGLESPDIC